MLNTRLIVVVVACAMAMRCLGLAAETAGSQSADEDSDPLRRTTSDRLVIS